MRTADRHWDHAMVGNWKNFRNCHIKLGIDIIELFANIPRYSLTGLFLRCIIYPNI